MRAPKSVVAMAGSVLMMPSGSHVRLTDHMWPLSSSESMYDAKLRPFSNTPAPTSGTGM